MRQSPGPRVGGRNAGSTARRTLLTRILRSTQSDPRYIDDGIQRDPDGKSGGGHTIEAQTGTDPRDGDAEYDERYISLDGASLRATDRAIGPRFPAGDYEVGAVEGFAHPPPHRTASIYFVGQLSDGVSMLYGTEPMHLSTVYTVGKPLTTVGTATPRPS